MNLFDGVEIVDTIEALAKILEVTPRTIYRNLKEGMPTLSDGRFDIGQCRRWREQRAKGSGPAPKPAENCPGELSKEHWDRINAELRAKMREQEFKRRSGELIDKTNFDALMCQVSADCKRCQASVRGGFLSIAEKLPPLLADRSARECAAILREEIYSILTMLAGGHEFIAEPFQKEGGQHDKGE